MRCFIFHNSQSASKLHLQIGLLCVSIFLFSCSKEEIPADTNLVSPNTSVHLTMGNPSNATSDNINPINYLMIKQHYTLSYHMDRGIPNWVSWYLDKSWMGTAQRQDDFRSDMSLPSGWYRVQASDYTSSGFDRGHNTPSADRTRSEDDNSSTFLMTNMIPQAPEHNQQTWANMESYCRKLAQDGNELYIIMGNYGTGGTGSLGYKNTIADGKVTVPARIWKVIVVLPVGDNDAARVTTTTRVIAVDTPNNNNVSASWGIYRTTVDAIENETGYNLLSSVSEAVQSVIEARVDIGPTN